MKPLFIALLLLTGLNLKAQTTTSLPPVFELKSDTAGDYSFYGGYSQMLIASDDQYTFEQVQHLPFTVIKEQQTPFDRSVKAIWMRYRLKNTLTVPVAIYIPEEMGQGANATAANRADIYTSVCGRKWAHDIIGAGVAWSQITVYKRMYGFYFTVLPGQEFNFYEKMYNENGTTAGVLVKVVRSIPNEVINRYEQLLSQTKSTAFIIGFVLLAGLVGLFFFYTSREKVYLYFALVNIAFALARFIIMSRDWLYKDTQSISNIGTVLLVVAGNYFGRFAYAFYQTGHYYPKWTKLSLKFNYCLFLICIPIIFHLDILFTFSAVLLWGMFLLNVLIICICSIFKNRRELVFNALTVIPFLLSLPLAVAYIILKPNASSMEYWVMGSYCWLVIMFLLKLVMRYKVLQQKILTESLEREKLAKEIEIEKNRMIAEQKNELERQVTERTAELSRSIDDLRKTQAQLVQAEKMASLGELTAGIAHEIQNPLNFVNNFSEVNLEMIAELKAALEAKDIAEALAITGDMQQNEEKVHHHGKRADGIVKGMLEHSRASTGQKQLTDLNKLADEYLRLAYHGLRAKDKSFNAQLITNFDENMPPVNVMAQDIGRVLLNLCNNAFYVVHQKQKTASAGYQPMVKLTTTFNNGYAKIAVEDNGSGIPDAIKDKIMQPFFTTKPTGQGTGLGLSLSYDIVVKGHNGKLNIETTQEEGSVFIVELPVGE